MSAHLINKKMDKNGQQLLYYITYQSIKNLSGSLEGERNKKKGYIFQLLLDINLRTKDEYTYPLKNYLKFKKFIICLPKLFTVWIHFQHLMLVVCKLSLPKKTIEDTKKNNASYPNKRGIQIDNKDLSAEITSKSPSSMFGSNSWRCKHLRPALSIWSLKKRSFRDISPHRFTC